MGNKSYYFMTTPEVVKGSREELKKEFNLVPPFDTTWCQPGKLVYETNQGTGIYRIDFTDEPPMVIFRYWDQRYNPLRDGKPMEEAIRFFTENYPYSRVVDSLMRDVELQLD